MSSTQVTNSDLSEPKEEINESNDTCDTSTLNAQDQEVVQPDSNEEEDKDLKSKTIIKEQDVTNDIVQDNEPSKGIDNETEQIPNGNEDQSTSTITPTTTTTTTTTDTTTTTTDTTTTTTDTTTTDTTTTDTTTTTTTTTTITPTARWSAVWDENVQAYYYWNTATNETTWENPEDPNNINNIYNNNLMSQPDYHSEYDYYYSQYGYYPEAYYYGYDNSALISSSEATATTTEPATNPLDTLLDKIDKEVKSKLDETSSKLKRLSSYNTHKEEIKNNDDDDEKQNEEHDENHEKNDHDENHDDENEQNEQNEEHHQEEEENSYYDQYQTSTSTDPTNDSDYQSFLAEHGGNDGSDYKVTARFNARTGKFQRDPTLNPEKFSADSKAIRQMSYFFDYEQFAESRGSAAANKRLASEASLGDSIRSPKKLNKKDIEMFKQKKKEKKDMKKKSWLLSEND